jgi:hypothetical protein
MKRLLIKAMPIYLVCSAMMRNKTRMSDEESTILDVSLP